MVEPLKDKVNPLIDDELDIVAFRSELSLLSKKILEIEENRVL
jgi:hypothetical protein